MSLEYSLNVPWLQVSVVHHHDLVPRMCIANLTALIDELASKGIIARTGQWASKSWASFSDLFTSNRSVANFC
jgi:hypothetical protein